MEFESTSQMNYYEVLRKKSSSEEKDLHRLIISFTLFIYGGPCHLSNTKLYSGSLFSENKYLFTHR